LKQTLTKEPKVNLKMGLCLVYDIP